MKKLLIGPVLLPLLIGCGEEEIRRYSVPKPETLSEINDGAAGHADSVSDSASEPTDRMLAAMIFEDGQAWYFKVTGDKDAVAGIEPEFQSLLKSTEFKAGKPNWTLPDGWRQSPGSQMRFATIHIGDGAGELELSVIPLPVPDGNHDEYVRNNVNRWREQLGLSRIGPFQMKDHVEQIAVGDKTAHYINIAGSQQGGGMGSAPFANRPRPPAPKPGPAVAPQPAARQSPGFAFTKPASWEPSSGSSLSRLAFEVKDGDRQVEFTATPLAAGAADLLPNVNRWRGQVGLSPTTPDKLEQEAEQISMGDVSGHYVRIIGRERAILGVIAVVGDQAWFMKLIGDASLAAREQKSFESLVKSIRF